MYPLCTHITYDVWNHYVDTSFFPFHPSPFTFVHDLLIHLYHSFSIFIQGQFAKLRLHLVCCHRFSPGAREPFGFPGSLTGLMCHDLRRQGQIKLWSIAHLLVFFFLMGLRHVFWSKGEREQERDREGETHEYYNDILHHFTISDI